MRPIKKFNAGISLFIAMALCGTAVAEIEEITVTAQKREENVQDVPISVSTFSDDFFTRSNVNTLRDMARYAPNLTLPQSSTVANQRIIMRGVGSVGNSAIEPTVAVFIDGVYYPRPSSIVGSMTDLERAEVLRGPQGTLFGRNASMGALNIVTKNPTNEHEGRISVGYGDYDEKRISGYINSAISEKAAARLSFQVSKRDGYGENTYTENGSRSTVGDWGDMTVRGKLLLAPSTTTDVLLTADYSRLRNEGAVTEFIGDTVPGQSLHGLARILPTGELPEAGDVYDHKLHQMHRDDADDEQWGLSGDVTWTAGGHAIRSVTAYRDWKNDSLDQSVIRLPADLVPTDQLYDAETFSQELQITSPEGEDFGYVLGLYYYDEEYTLDSNFRLGQDFCGAVGNLYRGLLLQDVQIANPLAPGGFVEIKHAGARDTVFGLEYGRRVGQKVGEAIPGLIQALSQANPQAAPQVTAQIQALTPGLVNLLMKAGTEISPVLGPLLRDPASLADPANQTRLQGAITKAKTDLNVRLGQLIPNPALQGAIYQTLDPLVADLADPAMPDYGVTTLRLTALAASQQALDTQANLLVENPQTPEPGDYIQQPVPVAQAVQGAAAGTAAAAQNTCVVGGTDMAVTDFKQDVKNYAAYAHATYQLSPQWRLAAGARFTRSEKEGSFVSVVHNPLAAASSPTNPFGLDLRQAESHPDLEHDEDKMTWMTNLSYFLDNDTMLFANFSTGFKSGGFNPEGFNSKVELAGRTRKFDTETTKNYELGMKRTMMEGRLVANATLYRTKISDFQERQFDGLNLIVHNSGDLTQQGVELDMLFQPREEFFATLGVSYLDSEFDTFPDATGLPGHVAAASMARDAYAVCSNQVAGGLKLQAECDALFPEAIRANPTRDMKGERNHFSPKWQVALSTEWSDALPDIAADWFVRGECQYMDDQNVGADTNQNPDTMQSSYNLFNGGAGVRSQTGDWQVSVFVKNIFDEEYCQTKYSQPLVGSLGLADTTTGRGAQRCSLGEPRTWSLVGSFLF
ncbi:MAG: TonB-dependent receptor [Gammaproteobacteria bacterium]|nr:TonB-dependent receptor [Gammaproteobacteria bacterium]